MEYEISNNMLSTTRIHKRFQQILHDHEARLTRCLNNNIWKEYGVSEAQHTAFAWPLVTLDYNTNQEQLESLHFLESNGLLNKVVLTLTQLCQEIERVSVDARQLQLKFLYLDEELALSATDALDTSAIVWQISESIRTLFLIKFVLQRYTEIASNIFCQLGALLTKPSAKTGIHINLTHICDYMSEVFYNILIFDGILYRSHYSQHWKTYLQTISALLLSRNGNTKAARGDSKSHLDCLNQLTSIFSGDVFQTFLRSIFALKKTFSAESLGVMVQQFNEHLKQQISIIDCYNPQELNELIEGRTLIKLNAFTVVFHKICGQVDSGSFKQILQFNGRFHGIMLCGNVPWLWHDFLQRNAENLLKPYEKTLNDLTNKQRNVFLQSGNFNLVRETYGYCLKVISWILKMDIMISEFNDNCLSNIHESQRLTKLKEIVKLFLQVIHLTGSLSFLIKAVISSHETLQIPVTKKNLRCICKLIELVQNLRDYFQDREGDIIKFTHSVLQYLKYLALHSINNCKKKLVTSKLNASGVDSLAALEIAERCLTGPPNKNRSLTAKLSLSLCMSKQLQNALSQEKQDIFRMIMKRIELISDMQTYIEQITDLSFLYWHQALVLAYLQQSYNDRDISSFKNIINIIDRCTDNFHRFHIEQFEGMKSFQSANVEHLRAAVISHICAEIETFLRLEVHVNLQIIEASNDSRNTMDIVMKCDEYKQWIHSYPMHLNHSYISIGYRIENYLSVMFYNLTTISLHDWKTYEEMRHLAEKRFHINALDDYLPNQSLDQGIDILEIMRKIYTFVSKYAYNMNSQIFVEQSNPNNRYLDTISIRHVANSLRTHGTGIINTAINFTYQFLRQKFYTFSQFLYDEHIKARLMKELRTFRLNKETKDTDLYSYERAIGFNKDIRKLGLSAKNETYMDLFRKVITHVGNAIGYIRLLYAGSVHANYSASLYLPKWDENLQFVKLCDKIGLNQVTRDSAKYVEFQINNLKETFSAEKNYYKVLIDAFQPFFQNPSNSHLRTFYLIVPPLIMNYTEHMLIGKSRIGKKEHDGALIFDDGFVVGLAYILKLLNQISDFNSLHWFSTVLTYTKTERRRIQDTLKDLRLTLANKRLSAIEKEENEKLQQTLLLSERRLNDYQTEINLLYNNLCSAKIFFR